MHAALTLHTTPALTPTRPTLRPKGLWRLLLEGALFSMLLLVTGPTAEAAPRPQSGMASWYGEAHRGKLMANGQKFDPDKFTAASWFYPLGTKVRVSITSTSTAKPLRSVLVTITDRGPAKDLVQAGRIIDLGHAPFQKLAHPDLGLVAVTIHPVK